MLEQDFSITECWPWNCCELLNSFLFRFMKKLVSSLSQKEIWSCNAWFLALEFYTSLLNKHIYSRVHISSDEVFSKILKKPSILQKWMIPHINGLLVSIQMKQKKIIFWKNYLMKNYWELADISKISKNWNPSDWVPQHRFFKNWFLLT